MLPLRLEVRRTVFGPHRQGWKIFISILRNPMMEEYDSLDDYCKNGWICSKTYKRDYHDISREWYKEPNAYAENDL